MPTTPEMSTTTANGNGNVPPPGTYYRTIPFQRYPKVSFAQQVLAGSHRHVARTRIATNVWGMDLIGGVSAEIHASDVQLGDRSSWTLRHSENALTLVELLDGWVEIETVAADPAAAERICERVAAELGGQHDNAGLTAITFWARDPDRFPQAIHRSVQTPAWAELAANYGAETRAQMELLLALQDCPAERMILWHGTPGTGKTHALRALAREWSGWCDVAFITDPEWFFGGSPTYLFDVSRHTAGHPAAEARHRSKLIVLEDAGEMMSAGAREQAGQKLSRLLNLTDGLLGQGLKVMVLITTNEPLSALHPAVIRPGRCLAEIEFGSLGADDANDWLAARGSQASVQGPTPLADLYAILAGHRPDRLATLNGHAV